LEAGEGKQALALLQDHAPAVIILDILLPYVNGQEVLNYINHAPHLSNTHVIIISSSARYEQLLDSTPHGHFFLKPVHPVDIANLLAQVVQAEV
jgi:CheY-like chemotaxis protein